MGRLTALVAIGALVALSGCSGASSPSPTPAPTLGPDRPPSAGPTGGGPSTPPASGGPGAVFAALPEFPAEGAYEITGATSTASGLLAVGYGPQAGEDFFGLRQGIAWRSTDGVTWEANPAPELAGVTPALVASIGSVDYLAGLLSACPQFSEEECEELPDAGYSIWRSTEGGEWEVLPQLPAMQQAISLDEMVALGDSLVVSGSAGDDGETATVWMSPDGVEWAETTDLAGLDPISALAAGDAGLVAFGTHFSADQENVLVRAASSADGVSFSPASVPELTNASIDSAAAGSGGFVGVGYGETEDLLLTGTALYSADGLSWVQSSASDGSTGRERGRCRAWATGRFRGPRLHAACRRPVHPGWAFVDLRRRSHLEDAGAVRRLVLAADRVRARVGGVGRLHRQPGGDRRGRHEHRRRMVRADQRPRALSRRLSSPVSERRHRALTDTSQRGSVKR